MDNYKVNVLRECLKNMKTDEYYLVRLRGDNTKGIINLDEEAIEVLIRYYEGKQLKKNEELTNLTNRIIKDIELNSYKEVEPECSAIYSDGALAIETKTAIEIIKNNFKELNMTE